jgi:acyl dehydratase
VFKTPVDDRYFEDYVPGTVHRFGAIPVEEAEVISFATRYDPQSIHIDPEAAKAGPFGGLIASGWMTAGLMMRLYCEHYLSSVASLASPGLDELRWPRPVRPGDVLSVQVTIEAARESKSKPDRGLVNSFIEVLNQADEVVMTIRAMNMIKKREIG